MSKVKDLGKDTPSYGLSGSTGWLVGWLVPLLSEQASPAGHKPSGKPTAATESCPHQPRADSTGSLSRWQTPEAEKSPSRPALQINGYDRPIGEEQRESDQCKREREQKPLSICPHQVGKGDGDAQLSSGSHQEIAATAAPHSQTERSACSC